MNSEIIPDKTHVSACGLFCRACGIFTATQKNNTEVLKRISERTQIPFEDIRCNGCRSDTRTSYCKNCIMISCTKEKGIDFCGQCDEYPCIPLKEFQSKLPHRVELWKSQERIKETGWENWFIEMTDYFSCRSCGSLNGWYDFSCRQCGEKPGNSFVQNHLEILKSPN